MIYDDYLPKPIPNVYDHDRGVLLLHWFRYEMCREALQRHAEADWRIPLRVLESAEHEELAKLASSPSERLSKASRERLTALQRQTRPKEIESRRALRRSLYHDELERLEARLDGYRTALNAVLGLPEDFTETAEPVVENTRIG